MGSRSGMPFIVAGVAETPPGNTNFQFDCIGFSQDITSGKTQSYANQIYQTFLLVRPNTDIDMLSTKIDKIYKEAAFADTVHVNRDVISLPDTKVIYLDPLKN